MHQKSAPKSTSHRSSQTKSYAKGVLSFAGSLAPATENSLQGTWWTLLGEISFVGTKSIGNRGCFYKYLFKKNEMFFINLHRDFFHQRRVTKKHIAHQLHANNSSVWNGWVEGRDPARKPTWHGAKTLVNNGDFNDLSLNWWVYAGFLNHQQYWSLLHPKCCNNFVVSKLRSQKII